MRPASRSKTLLYGVVASELEAFLAEHRSAEHEVPRFVEQEFRAFLDCGVLCRGFLRVRCGSCALDRVVGFSWRNGATHVVMARLELIEKLAALVPRPRYHIIHFYGVFAPAAKWRSSIVPDPPPQTCTHGSKTESELRRKNYTWAQLMARTFQFDVLECPRCSGRMKILAAIESPELASRILDCLGIVCRPPPVAPARSRNNDLAAS